MKEEEINERYEVYNPNNKPIEELPVIYGFNNGGSFGFMHAQLIAEDGTGMGSHLCSSEGYMLGDLGILKGKRTDRHEGFKKHYPDGYRMDFVDAHHPAVEKAYELNQKLADEKKNEGSDAKVELTVSD